VKRENSRTENTVFSKTETDRDKGNTQRKSICSGSDKKIKIKGANVKERGLARSMEKYKARVPKYRYDEFWMQQINRKGIEKSAEATNTPNLSLSKRFCNDEQSIIIEGERRSFMWVPKVSNALSYDDDGLPSMPTFNGLRLFAKVEEHSNEFVAVVDLVKDGSVVRMFACRVFHVGDGITFSSIVEESRRKLFVGGSFARRSDVVDDCNTYITSGRMLRCTRLMYKGDEIVVATSNTIKYKRYFESIDKMVVTENDILGKIAKECDGNKYLFVVAFADGRSEPLGSHDRLAFCYFE